MVDKIHVPIAYAACAAAPIDRIRKVLCAIRNQYHDLPKDFDPGLI